MWIRGFALGLLACVAASAQTAPELEKEAALGAQLAQEIRSHTTAIDNYAVLRYVEDLQRRLAAQLPVPKHPLRFEVAADDPCRGTHEPRVLPGGYVFLSAELFLAAENETEFVGMLAHTMAHVAQESPKPQVTRGAINGRNDVPLIFVGGWAACSESTAIPEKFLAPLRKAELEADALAVEVMSNAGYDPRALPRYILRVRPKLTERLTALSAAIEKLPAREYSVASPDSFEEVRRVLTPAVPRKTPPTLQR